MNTPSSDSTDVIISRIFASDNDVAAEFRLMVEALLSITARVREVEAKMARVEWFV